MFNRPWYIGDTINVGIGQSYWTVTPIQLAQSIATLVNKGKRIIPQIIRGNMQEDTVILEAIKERRPIAIKDEHVPPLKGLITYPQVKLAPPN